MTSGSPPTLKGKSFASEGPHTLQELSVGLAGGSSHLRSSLLLSPGSISTDLVRLGALQPLHFHTFSSFACEYLTPLYLHKEPSEVGASQADLRGS